MRIKMQRRNTMVDRLVPASAVVLLFPEMLLLPAWLLAMILTVGAAAQSARACCSGALGKRLAYPWCGIGTSVISGFLGTSHSAR
jgi:hypothetical protein